MATSVLIPPTTSSLSTTTSATAAATATSSFQSRINPTKFLCLSFAYRHSQTLLPERCRRSHYSKLPHRLRKFSPFASDGEASAPAAAQAEAEDEVQAQESETLEEHVDGAVGDEETSSEGDTVDAEEPAFAVIASLELYKEALASNNQSKVDEIEEFLKSLEDEKINLEQKVATISEQLSYERERVLRISADFDNFRKRTERERLSLVTNAQGELVETLLPVLDNFERAKSQIKIETEQEEKITNSYQSIYKQFVEILGSLGVTPVETIGKPFDPLLHEAIMREESTEFEEGIILEEYRKGFQLGERLLRPSMVKVSAGPGPSKPETVEPSEQVEAQDAAQTSESGVESKPSED